jgi:oligopeptide/dipeptide ABC transporter ATP-binding protein
MSSALKIEDLRVTYGGARAIRAVDGVSLEVGPGEALAVVGESGCGKSTLAKAVGGLLPPKARIEAGALEVNGQDVRGNSGGRRGNSNRTLKLGFVFQEPKSHLNPSLKLGTQLIEALDDESRRSRKTAQEKILRLLREVGINDGERRLRDYPHQLSGGIAQRVSIAMALAGDPDLVIADEPTSALDVTVSARVVGLLRRLQRERGVGLVHITHNLHLAAKSSDRVAVMYAGQIVEEGPASSVLDHPQMPYTEALLSAVPRVDSEAGHLTTIEGAPPDLHRPPPACRFAPRCPIAQPKCHEEAPELRWVGDSLARCWFPSNERVGS